MGWFIFMWFVILIVMLILYFIMIAFKVSKLYHDIEKRQNELRQDKRYQYMQLYLTDLDDGGEHRMILKIFQSSKKGC